MVSVSSLPEPPDQFLCPVSEELMTEPVMLVETGQTYDRTSIEDWFARGKDSCPLTGKRLAMKQLVPNYAVKRMIAEWVSINCGGLAVEEVCERLKDSVSVSDTVSLPGSAAVASVAGGQRTPQEALSPAASAADMLGALSLGGANSGASIAAAPSSNPYPDVNGLTQQDKVAHVLELLSSHEHGDEGFREAASYHMWQLKELALDAKCREVMLTNNVVALVVQALRAAPDADSAAHAALLTKRLAVEGSVVCQMMVAARVVDQLIVQLASRHVGCREAAAAALTFLGWNCWRTKQEVIVKLCQDVKQTQGSTNIVLAFRALLDGGSPSEAEAVAYAVHMLAENVQANVLEYYSCKNNALAGTLAGVLDVGSEEAKFAAALALKHLVTNPHNRQPIVSELLGLLREGGSKGQEQAAWLLWELAFNPAGRSPASYDPVVDALSRSEGLASALGRALAADAPQSVKELAAGLVHMLTYQDYADRDANRLLPDVDVDVVRFQLAAPGARVTGALAVMLSQPDAGTQTKVLATYALSNLAATRSAASCATCATAAKAGSSLLKKASDAACPHNPRVAVANQSACLAACFAMLNSANVAEMAAAVALLNNLCVADDTRDKAKAAAKKVGTDRVRDRLMDLIQDAQLAKQLSEQTKNGARCVLQRFDRHRPAKTTCHLICRALKPPQRTPLFPAL